MKSQTISCDTSWWSSGSGFSGAVVSISWDRHICRFETDIAPTFKTSFYNVLVDVVLGIECDLLATSKRWKIDSLVSSVKRRLIPL